MIDATQAGPGPRIRAAVALETEEGVLLVRHQKGGRTYWLLPGGGVEYGEATIEAARREVQEETGLDIEVGPLLLVGESLAPDRSRHVLHLIFGARRVGGALQVGQEARLAEARFVPFENLSALEMHPPICGPLQRALRQPSQDHLFAGSLWID